MSKLWTSNRTTGLRRSIGVPLSRMPAPRRESEVKPSRSQGFDPGSRARRPSVVLLATLSVGLADPASAQSIASDASAPQRPDGGELPVREHLLDNGMRFLLLERLGAPTVTFVSHVPVGSVNESAGITGISHFLEHLLFKGTTSIGTRNLSAELELFDRMDATHDSLVAARARSEPDRIRAESLESRLKALEDSARVHVVPNEYDRILSRNGARGPNATTGFEATQYFVSLPSNRAELWFVMESDRMRNPVFREFFVERDVIVEERRARLDTSPAALLTAAHLEAAFRVHPYGVPPIGHPEDMLSISRAEVEAYHERYYGPGNMTVAIVGQFDADSAVVWADRYFGPLQSRGSPPPIPSSEPPQIEELRVEIEYDAATRLRIGWKVPSALAPEAPALAILANILVGGTDTRLYRRLVREERLAQSVFAGTGPGRLYPGLFTIQAVPLAPHTPEEVEAAIYDELDRLRSEPPTADEIERVRTRLEAARVRRLVSTEALAFQLVSSQAEWGDWRETFRLQERMQAVSPQDVTDVLSRYFRPEGRTVAILRPAPESR